MAINFSELMTLNDLVFYLFKDVPPRSTAVVSIGSLYYSFNTMGVYTLRSAFYLYLAGNFICLRGLPVPPPLVGVAIP